MDNVTPLRRPYVVLERRGYVIEAANEDEAIVKLGSLLENDPEQAASIEIAELGEIFDAYPFQAD